MRCERARADSGEHEIIESESTEPPGGPSRVEFSQPSLPDEGHQPRPGAGGGVARTTIEYNQVNPGEFGLPIPIQAILKGKK
jgi:hypothetical protein